MNKKDKAPIKSFKDLNLVKTDLEAHAKEKFRKDYGEFFEQFPNGGFSVSNNEKIEHLFINRVPKATGTEKTSGLYVRTFDKGSKSGQGENFTLSEHGVLSPHRPIKDPEYLTLVRELVIQTLNQVDPRFFYKSHGDILPPGEMMHDTDKISKESNNESNKTIQYIDPRRISFMREQKDVLFAFAGENSGFRGYYGFAFPWGIVLENPKVSNATYFIKFDEPLKVSERVFKEPPALRFLHKDRETYLAEKWMPFANLPKAGVLNKGARRKYHPHAMQSDDQWVEKMSAELAKMRETIISS
jgi:hypothetical protein